jgi:hypothetical protein
MRKILTFQLENGKIMNIISSESAKKAKEIAIKNSKRLFGDSSMYITKQSKLINSEDWEKEKKTNYIGTKKYMTSFILDNVVQVITIDAASVKNAYNIVRTKYGIQDDLFMAVYEINQKVKTPSPVESVKISKEPDSEQIQTQDNTNKVSAKSLAKTTLSDDKKFNTVLNAVVNKIEQNYSDNKKTQTNFKMLVAMLNDSYHGSFSSISYSNMISAIACLCYYISPNTIKQDVIQSEKVDESNILLAVSTVLSKELQLYESQLIQHSLNKQVLN